MAACYNNDVNDVTAPRSIRHIYAFYIIINYRYISKPTLLFFLISTRRTLK